MNNYDFGSRKLIYVFTNNLQPIIDFLKWFMLEKKKTRIDLLAPFKAVESKIRIELISMYE